MTALDINNVPDIFLSYEDLVFAAFDFDLINPETHPDVVARVALKETMIAQMAEMIINSNVPLLFIYRVTDNGLKAAFLRVVGEHGHPAHFLPAIEKITMETGPFDWNLKWQILRAYRAMHVRFLTDSTIVASATKMLSTLEINADAALLAGIAAMLTVLGIP